MSPATIQRIIAIDPIEGADKIEVATVLGWKCVVKKNEFKVGDLCVYIEIDSVVPPKPEFEFLRQRHFVVKTIKLRKQLSQGLVMPISILENIPLTVQTKNGLIDGFTIRKIMDMVSEDDIIDMDVSEALGVIHYEKDIPAQLRATIRGNFPRQYVPKTDEPRVQGCMGVIQEMVGRAIYATVKMDGCSSTYIHCNGDKHVCSRNNSLQPDENNTFWKMEKKYDILNKLEKLGNYAIQGEVCGPGIQGNKMGLADHDLFIFNIYDIDKQEYLSLHDMVRIINENGFTMVPMANIGDMCWTQAPTLEKLLELAKGTYANGATREGIVIRPVQEAKSERLHGERMSIKVVNNDFLLEHKE